MMTNIISWQEGHLFFPWCACPCTSGNISLTAVHAQRGKWGSQHAMQGCLKNAGKSGSVGNKNHAPIALKRPCSSNLAQEVWNLVNEWRL